MNVYTKWLCASVFLFASAFVHAQDVHGVLRVVKGDVQIKSAKTGQMVKARIGEQVYPKDVIITGKDSRAKIVMVDNNEINVSPESQIEIQHYEYDPAAGKKDVLLNVIYGKVRSKVEQKYDGKSANFTIKTPSAVAGVRGTDFIAGYDRGSKSSQVVTFQGKVEFGTPGPNGTIANPVFVTPGNSATSTAGAAPSAPVPVPKDQLAKMDKDSKADSGGANAKGDGSAAPGGDKKGDKKDDKKDGAKSDGGGKGDGSGKSDGGGKGDGKGADSGGQAKGPDRSAASSGPATPALAPAPVAAGPSTTLLASDNPTSPDAPKAPDVPHSDPTMGAGGTFNKPPIITPPPCDYCTRVLENQKVNLAIKIRTGQ